MRVSPKKPPHRAPKWSFEDIKGLIAGLGRRLFERWRDLCTHEQANLGLWVPAGIAGGIAVYFALPAEPYVGWSIVSLLSATLVTYLMRHRGWLALAAVVSLCAALGFLAAQVRTLSVAAPVLQAEMRGVPIEGQVMQASLNQEGGTTLLLKPTFIGGMPDEALPARVRLRVRQEHAPIWPGDEIETRAMLWPPAEPVAPGAFDFARQAWFRGLGGTGVTLTAPEVLGGGAMSGWQVAIASTRESVARHVMEHMAEKEGPVAAALMTGLRHAIHDDVEQDLRDAGLAHILAISGLHMALFAGTLFWLVRAALALFPPLAHRYPIKKWAASVALLGALAYLFLSGGSVATQRAFIMAALMFIAVLIDRPAFSLRNVALAAIIVLLMRPESLLEPGFQMSFAAVTALVAVYQNREMQLLRFRENATGLSGAIRLGTVYMVTLCITSLVAGAATAPFAAYHFNRMAAFGLVGNIAAMPLVGTLIMPSALIAYILMPLGLEGPALWVMEKGLAGVIWVANEVSSWGGAVVTIGSFSTTALLLISLGGAWLALWQTSLRRAGFIPLLLGLYLASQPTTPDILVNGDARLAAVKEPGGSYLWAGRTPRYARESWLRRNGEAPDTDISNRRLPCDHIGCVADGTPIVALPTSSAAIGDDCREADIVIASVPVRSSVRRSCNAILIIDRFDVAREGAHAIYLDEQGNIERVETVRDWRGERPWSGDAAQ
ncbi:MAG: ComEC family competence protein [Rhodobiaceae bacterium]|nr:ComEC family competence protein [Rhodobiaceae bacterium]